MPTSYSESPQPSATSRTFFIWLLSNLGGTSWLILDFGFAQPTDVPIPLIIGLMAALISLFFVPLAIPFFALAQRACTGWKCRTVACGSVILVFMLANLALVELLPIGPVSSLLSVSNPYLVAALLAAVWLYRTQAIQLPKTASHKLQAVPVHRLAQLPGRQPLLAQ